MDKGDLVLGIVDLNCPASPCIRLIDEEGAGDGQIVVLEVVRSGSPARHDLMFTKLKRDKIKGQ